MFDIADPDPLLDEELAVPPLGGAEEVLLSLDAGAAVEEGEELESAGAAGLLQPSRAKAKYRPRVSAVKRVRMIPSMSG